MTTIERLAELDRHSVLLFLDRDRLQNRAPIISVRRQKLRAAGGDVEFHRESSRRLDDSADPEFCVIRRICVTDEPRNRAFRRERIDADRCKSIRNHYQ